MGNKGGQTTIKRQLAPVFWNIKRKEGRFIPKTSPSTHSKDTSYALSVLLRDVLKIATSVREVKNILNNKGIKVDGVLRYDTNFAVGLMDTIELIPAKQTYRLVPYQSKLLSTILINEDEKSLKLSKIKRKSIVRGNKIQYTFHDGKTIISEQQLKVGDTCLLSLPELKIIEHFPLSVDSMIIIIRGENSGKVGKIESIKEGTFSLPKRISISIENRTLEIPIDMVMVIGNNEPRLKVT
ncbi:MAG: 30S ribosomal protein S4e [Nitrososphaeraceae archaeon]